MTISHDEQLAVRRDHLADVAQDGAALLVGPVVDDVPHQVGVAAGDDAFEEAAGDRVAAIGDARPWPGSPLARSITSGRSNKMPRNVRVALQQRDQDGAVAAADVDDRVELAEVVGVDHRLRFFAVEAGHGGVEDLALARGARRGNRTPACRRD